VGVQFKDVSVLLLQAEDITLGNVSWAAACLNVHHLGVDESLRNLRGMVPTNVRLSVVELPHHGHAQILQHLDGQDQFDVIGPALAFVLIFDDFVGVAGDDRQRHVQTVHESADGPKSHDLPPESVKKCSQEWPRGLCTFVVLVVLRKFVKVA